VLIGNKYSTPSVGAYIKYFFEKRFCLHIFGNFYVDNSLSDMLKRITMNDKKFNEVKTDTELNHPTPQL
jgi:hypothetical protein